MQSDDYQKFFDEFMGESDRAAIVLGAAQMDELLKDILMKRLISPKKDLFDFNGPFGTFSARIDTAHATGAIDKSFANKIHLVRKIRNQCAHNIQSVDLNASDISGQITTLSDAFSDAEFWADNLKQAGEIYKKSGNTLTLRFAIALLVANLVMVTRSIQMIDGGSAHSVFTPKR